MKVSTPDGETWTISRQWMPRYEGKGLRARLAERHARRKAKQQRSRWWDNLDLPFDLDLEFLAVAVLAVIAIVLMIVFGIPLLLALFDVVFVLGVALLGVVSRVLFRRPWTIEAESSTGDRVTREVVGWRESRAAMRVLALELSSVGGR